MTPITTLTLVAAGLVGTATPVAAVHAVPWRFWDTTLASSISGTPGSDVKSWVLACPAGYTAVSGGVIATDHPTSINRMLEYPNPADGTYHITLYNASFATATVTLGVNCVWLDDVGTVTTVTDEFARDGNGFAGGILRCPEGTTVLSGGVDWSTTNLGRTISFSTPITDGTTHGTGWYVAGWSDTQGTLAVELRCVSSSLLDAEFATADDSTDGTHATADCGPGYRILTGGSGPAGTLDPGAGQGHSVSGPLDYRHWPAVGVPGTGVTLRALALCVPASTTSVMFTQTPAALSTLPSGTITFTASDVAGENITVTCFLDNVQWACTSGSPFGYGPLVDGAHGFRVNVQNQSGFTGSWTFQWTIDATVPVITNHTPTSSASLTGPFTITFSEPVSGVTTSSMTVHAEAANVDVAGTIARPSSTTATWTPKNRLVPGETYRVSFTSGIHDPAGNPLTATFYTVRTGLTVESTYAALERYWDLDWWGGASGGAFIVSRLPGSRAELTFTATAGQTVAVWAIRRPNGGFADIYLDGVKKATPSFYASAATRVRVYLSTALTAGTHTISIRPLGTKPAASSGSWVAVDNVDVGAAAKQESSLKQIFRRISSASAFDGSYDIADQATDSDSTPARFQLTFVGTGIKVYATKSSTAGQARIYVDGVLKATVNLNAGSTVYKAQVYSGTFALAQHVIRIEAVGTATGATSSINVDRITIN